jgi:diacylglycerol kinase family enzyme
MRPHDLADGIETILRRTPIFPGRKLKVDLIANPKAGGFMRPRFALKRRHELEEVLKSSSGLPVRGSPVDFRLHLTERSGHAFDIADRIISDSAQDAPTDIRLLLTAGGDGTSLETAARLVELPTAERSRFGLLRLPMGTGNDGSEGRDLVTALGRFLHPARLEARHSLKVSPAAGGGKKPSWAFNIASLGLDAYVAHMTNRLKTLFPGDSYKFMVDLASVMYDKIYRVVPMGIQSWNAHGQRRIDSPREYLLVAVGASGNRQYGSNKKILPDEDNVCLVSQTSLWRKLVAKSAIEKGQHAKVREVGHFSADRLLFGYSERIILQCDGEVTMLDSKDFPLGIERIPALYNILVPA